jgi:hypothetical protein
MKTFIAAVITLALVVTAISVNYVYLHKATDALIRMTSAITDSDDAQIHLLKSYWEGEKQKITLTVGHAKTDLVDALMIEMSTNPPNFTTAKSLLIDTFEKIKSAESLSIDGIL